MLLRKEWNGNVPEVGIRFPARPPCAGDRLPGSSRGNSPAGRSVGIFGSLNFFLRQE